MKNALFILPVFFVFSLSAQQKETFDLATYTVPTGWKKVNSTANVIGYTITNNQKGTYCQIGIYASTNSKGSLQADFESEWQELVVKTYKPAAKPQLVPAASENGWEAQGGAAPFEFSGAQSAALLITMSGYSRCMSIVVLTNTDEFQPVIETFLESVDLKKPETVSQDVTGSNSDNHSITGTWGVSASDQSIFRVKNGVMSTIFRQYTFNDNGTYTFITKTFDPLMDKLLLIKENGTYQISGNNLTVNPQKSVIEAWSKKDGTDKWGNLLTSQNRTLEKTTYRFTKHYFTGSQELNLVLQRDKETLRDGPSSSNELFPNAWYYRPISATNTAIVLPGNNTVQQPDEIVSKPAGTGEYHFSTTNFDDGWTSTVQEDWVHVAKGSIKILIHYPTKNIDTYNPDVLDGLKKAWNILVSPKYSTVSSVEFKPIYAWQTIEFAEADAVERTSGKSVHVVLFKMNSSGGRGKYMEFITPDKRSFEQEFGAYHETSSGWEKMESMGNYNKFAVASTDLKGKWTNDFTGTLQYVNAYTGASAGMDTHASNEKFEFGPGTTYRWNIGVASGFVGNIKFQSAKSAGTFSLPTNWQVTFSDIEGKPRTYNAFFSCVKGARILWFDETSYGRIE